MVSTNGTVNGITPGLTKPDGYFNSGTVTFTSGQLAGLSYSVRSYLNAGGIVRLQTPLLGAPNAGDTFTILPGCDKSTSTCSSRFSKLANYGGFPMLLGDQLVIDAHIGKSALPNLAAKVQFLVGPKRKAALDQLHRSLKTQFAGNGHQDVNVIGHDDEVVNHNSFGPHG